MAEVAQHLTDIGGQVDRAVEAVTGDPGASPVLAAVVREFQKKSTRAQQVAAQASQSAVREAIVEMEQAADSAKVAAEADPGATTGTRKAVLDAHLAICLLKSKVVQS